MSNWDKAALRAWSDDRRALRDAMYNGELLDQLAFFWEKEAERLKETIKPPETPIQAQRRMIRATLLSCAADLRATLREVRSV